jgi:2-polyprenyl-6-methoxyphenol hydroxylase-like FAD-dependent oxidoreductase
MAAAEKVLVVGGGPAGLCAATVLTKRGVDVEIVEINETLRPLGSGLTMMGPSLRALRAVDENALRRCVNEGVGHDAIGFGGPDGQVHEWVPLHQVAGEGFPGGFGITRPVFWGILADAAQEAGAPIRLSTTVSAIEQTTDDVEVVFSDGSRGTYDLVVGADGIHSKVRELVFGDASAPNYVGQRVWRVMVPRPADLSDDMAMYYGPRNKAGCNPVSSEAMYVFLVENSSEATRPPKEEWPSLVREQLADYDGVIAWVRERVDSPDQIDCRPLQAILHERPWHRGRVLLIGDAVHATTPHLAMGAGIAIEDAVVLGEELESDDPIDAILSRFADRRWERARLVVENSLQLSDWEKHPEAPDADPSGLFGRSFAALAAPV